MTLSALQQRPPRGAPHRKAVLFCPSCSHESPIDGWIEVDRADRYVYVCPKCENTVLSQPQF